MEPLGNLRVLPRPLHGSGEAIVLEDFQIVVRNVGSWYWWVKRSMPPPQRRDRNTLLLFPKGWSATSTGRCGYLCTLQSLPLGNQPCEGSDILRWTAPQDLCQCTTSSFARQSGDIPASPTPMPKP